MAIWLVGAAWMLFNAAIISMSTFTPDFLKGEGFSAASAVFLTSLVMWPALLLSPVVGYTIDRVNRKLVIIGATGVVMALLIAVLPQVTDWMLGLILFVGIVQALVPAPVFALAPEVVSPVMLGLGYGIISTCLNLGIVAGPAIVGLTKDATGSYQASYALMAGFSILMTLTVISLGIMLRHRGNGVVAVPGSDPDTD
jgi:MFS family permease